jgi:uncharacterized protein
MKNFLMTIFRDRHNELRSGWRLAVYLVLTAGAIWGTFSLLPAQVAGSPLVSSTVPLCLVLLITWLVTRYINHKPLAAIGLWIHPRAFRELGVGLLIGFLMMTGIFIVEASLGTIHLAWRGLSFFEAAGAVGFALFIFTTSAMFEELLFRGYPLQTLMQGVTFLPALLIMSLLFAVAHTGNPHATVLSTANVLLAGVWLSFAYLKTRSLWLPFGLHLAWNFSQTALYAFPTSGYSFATMRLFDAQQSGPVWITGGEFGPEGGILATIALIAATWYILKASFLKAPEGIITLDSVEDVLPPQPGQEGKA